MEKSIKFPSSPDKIPTIDIEILIYGYIRRREQRYFIVIPDYLTKLFIAFHGESRVSLFILDKNYVFLTSFGGKQTNKDKTFKLEIDTKGTQEAAFGIFKANLVGGNSINLPPKLFNYISEKKQYDINTNFNALFSIKSVRDFWHRRNKIMGQIYLINNKKGNMRVPSDWIISGIIRTEIHGIQFSEGDCTDNGENLF